MAASILGAWLFGQKNPKVPEMEHVNPQDQQLEAIRGNIAAMPDLAALTKSADELSVAQLERMLPGASNLLKQGTATISDWISGKISPDMERYLRQSAAETGTAGGTNVTNATTSGSTFDIERYLEKNVGLRLGLVQSGLSAAERWVQEANARRPFNFTSMFVTPGQQIANAWQNENARFSQQWLQNRINVIDPLNDAIRGFFDWVATTGENVVNSYTGGMGAAGGAGQPAGGGGGGNAWWGGSGVSPNMEEQGFNRLYGGGGGTFGGGDSGFGGGIAGGF